MHLTDTLQTLSTTTGAQHFALHLTYTSTSAGPPLHLPSTTFSGVEPVYTSALQRPAQCSISLHSPVSGCLLHC